MTEVVVSSTYFWRTSYEKARLFGNVNGPSCLNSLAQEVDDNSVLVRSYACLSFGRREHIVNQGHRIIDFQMTFVEVCFDVVEMIGEELLSVLQRKGKGSHSRT